MKAVLVAAFDQEKALVGAFYVIMNLRMELFEALTSSSPATEARLHSTTTRNRRPAHSQPVASEASAASTSVTPASHSPVPVIEVGSRPLLEPSCSRLMVWR